MAPLTLTTELQYICQQQQQQMIDSDDDDDYIVTVTVTVSLTLFDDHMNEQVSGAVNLSVHIKLNNLSTHTQSVISSSRIHHVSCLMRLPRQVGLVLVKESK